jgi:probable rRNA maturation factor
MNVTVDLQNASGVSKLPLKRQFSLWAGKALQALPESNAKQSGKARLSIRVVGEAESATLNSHYRHKQGPTNILTFPVPPELAANGELGDLAICAQVVRREAIEQGKDEQAHWAHLVVHGVLHLQGYDHELARDAETMEAMEIRILKQLDIGNPYQ